MISKYLVFQFEITQADRHRTRQIEHFGSQTLKVYSETAILQKRSNPD